MTPFKQLTKAEEQIMQVLWLLEEAFTKDIIEHLPEPKPHYNTVSTLLRILTDKGFVVAKPVAKSYLFKPLVKKEAYSKKSLKQFIGNYFNGSFSDMISFFAKEKDISVSELEQVLKEMKKIQK